MEVSTGDLEYQVPDDFCHENLGSIGINYECIDAVSKPLDAAEPVHNKAPDVYRLMHPVENDCGNFCHCDVERAVLHPVSNPETRNPCQEITDFANGVSGRAGQGDHRSQPAYGQRRQRRAPPPAAASPKPTPSPATT